MLPYSKLVFPKYQDKQITGDACLRLRVAREQAEMTPPSPQVICRHIRKFFSSIHMKSFALLEWDLEAAPIQRGFYSSLQRAHRLRDKEDIIWMKFTKPDPGQEHGFLGVVATGCDINFDTDNTSGKIVTRLGKAWNDKYVLLVLLKERPAGWTRQQLESGIGNYLIQRKVPILDYYSHNL